MLHLLLKLKVLLNSDEISALGQRIVFGKVHPSLPLNLHRVKFRLAEEC